ncbi:MAG: restriction endonuclease subunit S [Thermus sp.]|nr:restriction endonuclease subunit S [Thermus sp.]
MGFANKKRGATITGLPRRDLVQMPNPLPPLPEQREIARILQAVDRRIAAEEAYARALEDLFQSLLRELMSGKRRVGARVRANDDLPLPNSSQQGSLQQEDRHEVV